MKMMAPTESLKMAMVAGGLLLALAVAVVVAADTDRANLDSANRDARMRLDDNPYATPTPPDPGA